MSTRKPRAPPKAPGHPLFNFADSDITLISSDGVRFHVHKARLSAVSMAFKDMFEGEIGAPHDAKDTPQLDEAGDTLAILLAMCYPFEPDAAPFDLLALEPTQLIACYEASEKYRMWVAQQYMLNLLMPLVQKDPFRLVRTAYVLRKQNLLAAAARATLAHDVLDNGKQYREAAGETWTALLEYHMAYKRAVIAALYDIVSKSPPQESDRYQIPYCSLVPDGAHSCKDMQSSRRRWHILHQELSNRTIAQWPGPDLVSFATQFLDSSGLRTGRCASCIRTFKELCERATTFEPNLVLTLEQIDRPLQ